MDILKFLESVLKDLPAILSLMAAISGFVLAAIKNLKAKIANKENEVKDIAHAAIIEAERLLQSCKGILKEHGIDTGEFKYVSVIAKIQTACANIKLAFDADYWNDYIEKEVAMINATRDFEEVIK